VKFINKIIVTTSSTEHYIETIKQKYAKWVNVQQ